MTLHPSQRISQHTEAVSPQCPISMPEDWGPPEQYGLQQKGLLRERGNWQKLSSLSLLCAFQQVKVGILDMIHLKGSIFSPTAVGRWDLSRSLALPSKSLRLQSAYFLKQNKTFLSYLKATQSNFQEDKPKTIKIQLNKTNWLKRKHRTKQKVTTEKPPLGQHYNCQIPASRGGDLLGERREEGSCIYPGNNYNPALEAQLELIPL